MKLDTENIICRNCQTEMPKHSLYCPKCSQKNTDGRIPIWSFLKDILENVFNLDSKLFRTMGGLFVPGKLTDEFFKGRHKSFSMPSKLFFVSAIAFFAMVSVMMKKEIKGQKLSGDIFGIEKKLKKKENKAAQLKELKKIKSNLGKNISNEMMSVLDSMEMDIQKSMIDTSKIRLTLFFKDFGFLASDYAELSADSIIRKYDIDHFMDQIIFKQGYKLTKEPESLLTSLIGNLTWMLLLLIPSMALIFKILYIRNKKFYVEHLVFLFHVHAFVLLAGAILMTVRYFLGETNENEFLVLAGLLFFYSFFALKRVYEQGWGKTFFKLILITFSYLFVLVICISAIFMVSFLLF